MLAAPQCDSPLQSGADILRICASAVDKEKRSEEDGGVDGGDVRVVRSKEVRLLAWFMHFPPRPHTGRRALKKLDCLLIS